VLEGAQARDRVELAEAVAVHLQRVVEPDVEAVAPARLRLSARQRDPHPLRTALAHVVQERSPAAAEVQHAPAGIDADLIRHVLVLASLGLLERHREVAVVLRAAEVRELSEAEPEDAVDQRIRELEVGAVGHSSQRA
jgi:hypothetical protein